MKILSVTAYSYGEGSIVLGGDNSSMSIKITKEENNELIALAWQIFQRKQSIITNEVARAAPLSLPAPTIDDADFDEVPF